MLGRQGYVSTFRLMGAPIGALVAWTTRHVNTGVSITPLPVV